MNIFDFDGTLYRGDSSFDFWKYCLKTYPQVRKRIPKTFIAGIRYLTSSIALEQFKERFYEYFADIDDIDNAVNVFWDTHANRLRQDVLAYASRGDLVVSASPEFLLLPICNRLELNLIASEVDKRTGELLGPNCKGREKVKRIKESGYPESYHKAFSDSLSDAPIERLAKEGYLVTKTGIEPFPFEKLND